MAVGGVGGACGFSDLLITIPCVSRFRRSAHFFRQSLPLSYRRVRFLRVQTIVEAYRVSNVSIYNIANE